MLCQSRRLHLHLHLRLRLRLRLHLRLHVYARTPTLLCRWLNDRPKYRQLCRRLAMR